LPQHFLLTSAARTLSLASVARMSDEEAETAFRKIRWASSNGDPFCPKCGCAIVYDCRRANGTARWRCKACLYSFLITSGTLFASRKLPLRAYLMAVAIFCNEVKGKSMLAMARDLGIAYQTSFVLAHKMREAMASEMKGAHIGGDGRKAEIDGGYFGGYVKPANRVENRRDHRLRQNQSGRRKVVVVIPERDGKTLPGVFASEVAALNFIRTRIARGTEVYADEGSAWNDLHGRFAMHRINHQEAYSLGDGIYTNTPSHFSRGCAGLRSGITTTSQVRTLLSLRKGAHGARITGATPTVSRPIVLWRWRCGTSRASISANTGGSEAMGT
jgi:transposase-like protein